MNSKNFSRVASSGQANSTEAILDRFSLETTTRRRPVEETLSSELPKGTSIYITALAGITTDEVVGTVRLLRQAGLNPVPHLGARYFETGASLLSLLERLRTAGVDQVLLIGGDVKATNGPFTSAHDVLCTGILEHHGIRRVGFAGYPEEHPRIDSSILDEALATKIEKAKKIGLEPYVVTQFCFSSHPIKDWLVKFWARFPEVPVHVGLAGPAAITTLLKYAVSCGIGPSFQALRNNRHFGRLLTEADPSAIIDDLVGDEAIASRIAQFHYFPFGGIRRTSSFIRQLSALSEGRKGGCV
jgi:methylenetetrahydrofolate reductase (NADPH)